MNRKNSCRNELISEIKKLAQSQGLDFVFTSFLEITANCIAAQVNPYNAAVHEERYNELVSKMKPETLNAFARMFVLLWLAIREQANDPCDVLGGIYHELNLNSEWNGQFFTPDSICRLMAEIALPIDNFTDVNEPVTINEPACGSGAMIIGAVWKMKQKNFDFQRKCFFIGQDNDIRCVWMTYIQLSLYGIPAMLIYGDTLTQEEWSRWYTPNAILPFSEEKVQKGA